MAEKKPNLIQRIFGITPKPPITESVQTDNQKTNITDNVIKTLKTSSVSLDTSIDALSSEEKKLFELYEQMDLDAVISAALDLYADAATLNNTKTGHVASIKSSDARFQEEINDFLWNVFKVDSEAWGIVRDLAKYGKVFLDTKANRDGREWSFSTTENPQLINPLIQGSGEPKYFAVSPEENYQEAVKNKPYQYVRPDDNKFGYNIFPKDKFIVGLNNKKFAGKMDLEFTDSKGENKTTETFKILTGRSILESIISSWQMLNTMENALLTNRLTKATQFKIVEVDVSDSTNVEATKIMEDVKNAFKNSESIDLNSKSYRNRLNPVTVDDLIFLAKKGERGVVNVKPVGGEQTETPMGDINYMRNKVFAGLASPKAYLGFEEETPGGLGEQTLSKIDERHGRIVKRLQNVLRDILRQSIEYYWAYSRADRYVKDMPDYIIELGQVSTKESEEKRNQLTASFSIATSILSMAKEGWFIDKIDGDKMFKYIFEEVLNLDTSKFDNTPYPEEIDLKTHELELQAITENAIKAYTTQSETRLPGQLEGTLEEFLNTASLEELLEEYDLILEDTNYKRYNFLDIMHYKRFRGTIQEATYKNLKDDSKSKDPKRLPKSKKIILRYTGLDENNYITFVATAEDPEKNKAEGKPTSYNTKVSLKDLIEVLKMQGKTTDLELVRAAIEGDIAVSCTCPASKYWGQQYVGTQKGYSIDKNDIAPTRNIPTQVVCKHILSTLQVLPFWTNTIVRDLRAKGVLKSGQKSKQKLAKQDNEE